MLQVGKIQPLKAPYEAPILFQEKVDGSLKLCVLLGFEQGDCEEQVSNPFDFKFI